jgi:hypothetical protein
MALPSYYSTGTATVAANGTTVTGQGTAWSGALQPGDLFGTHKGLAVRIAAVNSNTSLTLAYPWPGAAQTAAAYEVQIVPDEARVQEQTRLLLEQLASGNLSALAALTLAADRLPYATGAGQFELTPLTAFARSLLDDANAGVAQSTLGISDFVKTLLDDANAAAFRATLGASAYEAGSFVPALGGTGSDGAPTYVTRAGTYVKMGRFVFVNVYMVISSPGGISGQLTVKDLPFGVASGVEHRSDMRFPFWSGLTLPSDTIGDLHGHYLSANIVRIHRATLSSGAALVDASTISGTLTLYGSLAFQTNS